MYLNLILSLQLALYRLPQYLLLLQGEIVPHVIGVFANSQGVDVKMELPHPLFWFEASSNMPEVLKARCIEAYRKLHMHGILHDSVELRHILVNGSGRVQIVDFTKSRAKTPAPEYGIAEANDQDFEREMREVMYKLNYRSAKSFETSRYLIGNLRSEVNRRNEKAGFDHRYYITGVPRTGDTTILPFPDEQLWKEWNTDSDRRPLKFEVPGRTRQTLDIAWKKFKEWLYREEIEYWRKVYRSMVQTPARGPSLKRKASTALDDTPSSKRLCSSPSPFTLTSTTPGPQDITMGNELSSPSTRAWDDTDLAVENPTTGTLVPLSYVAHLVKYLSDVFYAVPTSSQSSPSNTQHSEDIATEEEPFPELFVPTTSNIYSVEECGPLDLPIASSFLSSEPRNPVVRDFVDKPFDGPKGFYVPYPPLETRVSLQRTLFMRAANAAKCTQAGLPYNFDRGRLEYAQNYPPEERLSGFSKGAMKRKQEQLEELNRNGRPKKKQRLAVQDHESKPGCGYGTTFLDIRGGRFLSESEFIKRQARNQRDHDAKGQGKEPASGVRGILKPTPPVKTFSYNKEDWPVPQTPLSPKMGPEKIAVRSEELRAVYNSVIDQRLDFHWVGPFMPIAPNAAQAALVSDLPKFNPPKLPRRLEEELLSFHQESMEELDEDDWTDFRARPNSGSNRQGGFVIPFESNPRPRQDPFRTVLQSFAIGRIPDSSSSSDSSRR